MYFLSFLNISAKRSWRHWKARCQEKITNVFKFDKHHTTLWTLLSCVETYLVCELLSGLFLNNVKRDDLWTCCAVYRCWVFGEKRQKTNSSWKNFTVKAAAVPQHKSQGNWWRCTALLLFIFLSYDSAFMVFAHSLCFSRCIYRMSNLLKNKYKLIFCSLWNFQMLKSHPTVRMDFGLLNPRLNILKTGQARELQWHSNQPRVSFSLSSVQSDIPEVTLGPHVKKHTTYYLLARALWLMLSPNYDLFSPRPMFFELAAMGFYGQKLKKSKTC